MDAASAEKSPTELFQGNWGGFDSLYTDVFCVKAKASR
jgi:hypothetical protein